MSPALEIINLHAGYKGGAILRDVSFSLENGRILAILGLNGAGKSTLLRCAAGLLHPDSGLIKIKGKAIGQYKKNALARVLALAPQETLRPAGFKVGEFVLFGRFPWLSWTGFYSAEDRERASRAMLESLGGSFASRHVESLSGGEWLKACLARSLAQLSGSGEPILLLDEPAASLDLASRLELRAILEKRRRSGFAIAMTGHDCNLASLCATHMLGLKNGRVLFYGPRDEVFTEKNLGELYEHPVHVRPHPDNGAPQAIPRLPGAAG